MLRSFAISLGALAMGLVVMRGVCQRELAGAVAMEAIVAMILFMGIGAVAGWIADYLVRDATERLFRTSVDRYRKGMIEAGYIEPDSSEEA